MHPVRWVSCGVLVAESSLGPLIPLAADLRSLSAKINEEKELFKRKVLR